MSVECRDWLKTLWPASYKGVPFFFEQDKEKGGRDNVKHVFPHRDQPFIEDMGEALRFYSGSAYVHGDNADALAGALKAALVTEGAGMLVVPYFGPVIVHCETFERATQRDQMGYVAFELEFVRSGAASAIISIPMLQNVGFAAADALAGVLGSIFPQMISTLGQADYVVSAVTDTLASAAATLDVQRQSYPVDPVQSSASRDALAGFIAGVADTITDATPPSAATSAAASVVTMVRQLADAMPADTAVRAMLEIVDAFPAPPASTATIAGKAYASANAVRATANAAATARLVRLAALTAYAEAVMRQSFAARPDGITARAEVAERFETELYETTGAANADLYVGIETLRGGVISWLTQLITTLAPVVKIETARIMPSLAIAWTMYADPVRADELVARNKVRHPSFMPREIEALAR